MSVSSDGPVMALVYEVQKVLHASRLAVVDGLVRVRLEEPQFVVRVGRLAILAIKNDPNIMRTQNHLNKPPTICGLPLRVSRKIVPQGEAWIVDPDKREPLARIVLVQEL